MAFKWPILIGGENPK
uniref:Uncharacterized protein n=1 Tax=Lepeophtheirus salmonis TaxID=72036 RepID=A0A0K2SXZ5_LEPSM